VIREVQRVGRSRAAAEKALSEALHDRARIDAAAEIAPTTRLAAVAEVWFTDLSRQRLWSAVTRRQQRKGHP